MLLKSISCLIMRGKKKMKIVLMLLCMAVFAFADNDGCFATGIATPQVDPSGDAISITVVNDWAVPYNCLGLDVFEGSGFVYVLGCNSTDDVVQAYENGSPLGALPLDAANTSCFGVAWNNDPDTDTYYTDDWSASTLFYTDDFGSTWTTEPNPAGNGGRGMDFDGTDYWMAVYNGGLYRFQPGVGAELFTLSEVPAGQSGVAVFPYMGDVGVAVTCYQTHNVWIYVYDGANLTYVGSAACPGTIYRCYGLAYSANDGYFYWSFAPNSGNYHIAQLDIEITSLSRDTWAGIKTSF